MIRGRLGPALDDLRRLWDAGTDSGLSDAQLLDQFAAHRDERAFDALLARHGPLVWSVCRSILSDPHDVEDAFQATFLILVRKTHTLWIGDSLCSWLYRVSYRVAQEARAQRDRRRVRERALVDRVAIAEEARTSRDELLCVLSQEINRLPEKYRLPIVLCGLEGLTRNQAAGQLGWPPGTVATRLARGQDLLRRRMRRRLGDDVDGLGAWLGGVVSASVPAACREATVQAAVTLCTPGSVAAGLGSSAAALAQGIHLAMVWARLRSFLLFVLGLAAITSVTWGWLHSGTGQAPPAAGPGPSAVPPQDLGERPEPPKPKPAVSPEGGDRLTYGGKVLDTDGKPLSGASVYLDLPYRTGPPLFQKLGVSGSDGRFRATVSRQELTKAGPDDLWKYANVVATAPGYGPVWESAAIPAHPNAQRADDLALRLAKDDVPIEGRILTAEGRPVVGARIVAFTVTYKQKADGKHIPWDSREEGTEHDNFRLGNPVAKETPDADGRFRMTGLGRDRLVSLWMNGPDVAEQELQVQTRRVSPRQVEVPVNGRPVTRPMYGALFVHIAEPGRSLQGVVRERGTGKPIAGALANTLPTDAQGRFHIDNLPRKFVYPLQVQGPAGSPYFCRSLTVESHGNGLDPVAAEIELSRGVLIRGRLTVRTPGKPIRGRVFYAPLKGNPNVSGILGQVENRGVSDEAGRFAVVGLPGRGVLIVTAGAGDDLLYPRLREASLEDRKPGIVLPDDQSLLDALPRPVSLIGSHAYQVIDIPEGGDEFQADFNLSVKPGRTVSVRLVDPSGESLRGVTVFGLREPSLDNGSSRGDGTVAVHDLDAAWPRRVFFLQSERELAGFLDLTGDESGGGTARLSPCGSILGRVIDSAGKPIAGAQFGLVYDDVQGIPHIAFPDGRWMPTDRETNRDQRTNPYFSPRNSVTLTETSGEDGRFRISGMVPGVKFHLQIIIDQAGSRLGPKSPYNRGEKLLLGTVLSAGQILDLGDVRVLPEELRGDPPATPPLAPKP